MSVSRFALAGLFVIFTSCGVNAEDSDRSLLDYAVGINQAGQSRSGTGVFFGDGFVLTASHVVGSGLLQGPTVTIAGQQIPARTVKQDTFEQSDLALLSVDEQLVPMSLHQRKLSLCDKPPWPGQDVVVVIPEEAVHSHVLSPAWLPLKARQYDTVIGDVASTGNSGSGVFDAQSNCLLGIMSRKISQFYTRKDTGKKETFDIAKYFVPASKIMEFLPHNLRVKLSGPSLDTAAPAQ